MNNTKDRSQNKASYEVVTNMLGLKVLRRVEHEAEVPVKYPESLYRNITAMDLIRGMTDRDLSQFVHHLSCVLTVEDHEPEAFRQLSINHMNEFLQGMAK